MLKSTLTCLFALFAAVLLAACNASPTVPLPPPEAYCSSPDAYGWVNVTGESDVAVEGDIALVFNETTDDGAMKPVNPDGSFDVALEAEVGDTLLVQINHDGELSEEAVVEVPSG